MIEYGKEYFKNIITKEQFISFMNNLSDDFIENNTEWNNKTIDDFLKSVSAWCEDYVFEENSVLNWEDAKFGLISLLFYMGKIYE